MVSQHERVGGLPQYIKTISIQGFKSYRDEVKVDPFSPRNNVVVGRNGSGKSNFFAAIRFVLSDAYTSLSREERQRLLHEGSSTTTTLSAFVEIVFDNSDGRFPTSLPEVHLRRTIGLKKDEYSLDRKSVTKAEVMNFLESAGFSKSNPYYIVPQGRITHLTNMSDKERLNLLKEVAGTKVYEQKRAESVRIMEETHSKRAKIDELLETIESRLEELEGEKDELKQYQESDRDRRCLEYALFNQELKEVTAKLDQIEDERSNDVHDSNERRKEFNDLENRIQRVEEKLTEVKHSLATTQISHKQDETERADLVRSKAEVQCVIADFEQAGENNETRRLELAEQLDGIDKRVAKASEDFMAVSAQYEVNLAQERQEKERLETTQSKLQVLFAKQGRSRQFASQADRDQFLNKQIKGLQAYEQQQQKTIADLQRDVANAKANFEETAKRAQDQLQGEEERREHLKQMSEEATKLKLDLDGMQEKRKELWREDGKLSQSAHNAKGELESAERSLQSMMDRDTAMGLRSVKAITKRLNLQGVYGPLYELFDVSDKYKTAVETVAGGSLFHVVVDTDQTADQLIKIMNQEKSGRVTFMPLNRLKSANVQYPKSNDAVPMIQKLRFDRMFQMAFEQVFGRTIICDDLSVAAQYTRSHNLNAVTDEGDRVDRKGALTGGYHDVRRSRLDAVRKVKHWQKSYETDAERHQEVKESLIALEQEISQTMGKIQKIEARRKAILEDRGNQARQANWTQREEETARQRVTRLEGTLSDAEAQLRGAATQRAALQEELKTPLQQQLSPQEVQELDTLSQQAEALKEVLLQASNARQASWAARSQLEIELTENLRRRREEIRSKLDDLEGAAGAGVLQAGEVELRKSELNTINRSITELDKRLDSTEKEIEKLQVEISELSGKLEDLQLRQTDSTRAIMRAQKNAERYLAKRQMLVNRRDECNTQIRDLGVLPEEAFSKYRDAPQAKILKKLNKVTETLKKFAHVNKKAFEQYNNFTKQRDELMQRREELEESAKSIKELIETLDQRKDEAIERTFKQVSKYFEEVFERLVPAGKGQLIMQKKMDGAAFDETLDSTNGAGGEKSEIDNYTGVSIRVSFNSKEDEGLLIQQLSGGQKSLVALATVFAIQKCDPAPFYLFDEIDANLDPQYRTAVASMIHQLSDSAQFITTTFRPEMLMYADKFYGVFFDKQKVSDIKTISQEEAYKFIETAAELKQ